MYIEDNTHTLIVLGYSDLLRRNLHRLSTNKLSVPGKIFASAINHK
jgi:hypothetical protein